MLRSIMSPILGVVSDLDGSLASLACQKNKRNLLLYFFSDKNKITQGNRLKFATLGNGHGNWAKFFIAKTSGNVTRIGQ